MDNNKQHILTLDSICRTNAGREFERLDFFKNQIRLVTPNQNELLLDAVILYSNRKVNFTFITNNHFILKHKFNILFLVTTSNEEICRFSIKEITNCTYNEQWIPFYAYRIKI